MSDNMGGSGPVDVNALLTRGADALGQERYEDAERQFGQALGANAAPDVQYYVAYHLSAVGRNDALLALLRPYYRAADASPELAVTVLHADQTTGDADLVGWLVTNMPVGNPAVTAVAVQEANVWLSGRAAGYGHQPQPPFSATPVGSVGAKSGRGAKTWLVVGAVVVVVVGLAVGAVALSGSSGGGGNKQAFCSALATFSQEAANNANPPQSEVKSQLNTLINSAPDPIKPAAQALQSDVAKAAAIANGGSVSDNGALALGADTGVQIKKLFTWGEANCPAGTVSGG
jgi:hypothetical protein